MAELDLLAMISLAVVMMIGLPHGALDGAVATAVGYGKSSRDIAKFSISYVLIAAIVVAVWMVIPIFSLTLFLLISMVHFGLGDHNAKSTLGKYIQVICHGGLVVVVIPHFHYPSVEPIFMTLTGVVHSSQLSSLWGLLILLGGIFCISALLYAGLAIRYTSLRIRFLEFLLLTVILASLPPLTGFALYFCGVHTVRHVKNILAALNTHDADMTILPLTAIFTVLTWGAAGLILVFRPDAITFNDVVLRLIFIGLAALTVPHMMLVDGKFRPKFLSPMPQHAGKG